VCTVLTDFSSCNLNYYTQPLVHTLFYAFFFTITSPYQFTPLLNLRSVLFGLTPFVWLHSVTPTPSFWRQYHFYACFIYVQIKGSVYKLLQAALVHGGSLIVPVLIINCKSCNNVPKNAQPGRHTPQCMVFVHPPRSVYLYQLLRELQLLSINSSPRLSQALYRFRRLCASWLSSTITGLKTDQFIE
jgi:hypothetical protein